VGGLAEPPDEVHGTLHPDAADVDPLGGRRKGAGVVPVEILREVKTHLLVQRDQETVSIETPGWRAAIPHAAQIDHEASIGLQRAVS
jgi:hypothetical protein